MSDIYPPPPGWLLTCAQVITDVAVAIDRNDFDWLLSLCTDDTEFEHAGGVARGKEELLQWFAVDRPAQIVRHVCSNFSGGLIEPGVVRARTYFTVYRGAGRPSLPVIGTLPTVVGEWQDTLVFADQAWRIRKRSTRIDFRAA